MILKSQGVFSYYRIDDCEIITRSLNSMIRFPFADFLSQRILRDAASDRENIAGSFEFKNDFHAVREEQHQLAVRDDLGKARCLDAIILDFRIRQGAVVFSHTGDALYVNRDDALVCEDDLVADGFKHADCLFAGDVEIFDVSADIFLVGWS